MDGNPPAKASDKGSIPVPGRLHICRATKPVHNYWAGTLGSMSHNYPICVPHLLKPTHLEPALHSKGGPEMRSLCTTTKSSPRLLQIEKAHAKQWRPSTAKNKTTEKKKKEYLILSASSWFFLYDKHMISRPDHSQTSKGRHSHFPKIVQWWWWPSGRNIMGEKLAWLEANCCLYPLCSSSAWA